jgi:hypothetical protein
MFITTLDLLVVIHHPHQRWQAIGLVENTRYVAIPAIS